jgi:radical SAM/Cys-rich protein
MHIIDRCNLTILFETGMEDLAKFLAEHRVEVIASLPCYSKDNVDKQRGQGTFGQSIQALQKLNSLGYGKSDSDLILNLVYNPVGAHLPPSQEKLENDYKECLRNDFGIVFNKLYTITNMPITRYAKYLKAFNQLESYTELLINNFNPHTLDGLMCRNTLNISWDGRLFDCDFNQMLGMGMRNGKPFTVFNISKEDLENWQVLTANHCFGCTAGAGSSCQGALK